MKLTGKCKEDFEKWFMTDYIFQKKNVKFNIPTPVKFYRTVSAMQYGVYVDFFDSVKIFMDVSSDYEDMLFCVNVEYEEDSYSVTEWDETRNEGRINAIKKANEIYNENNS